MVSADQRHNRIIFLKDSITDITNSIRKIQKGKLDLGTDFLHRLLSLKVTIFNDLN